MRRAVYAGSFDPLTNGHLWMIQKGAMLFDELVVALGVNPDKNYTFTMEERQAMLRETVGTMDRIRLDNYCNKFLVQYAREVGAEFVLRGIRTTKDYEFERGMRYINEDLYGAVTTVFLMPPRPLCEISSSMVKGLIGPYGWQAVVRPYVPGPVYEALLAHYPRT